MKFPIIIIIFKIDMRNQENARQELRIGTGKQIISLLPLAFILHRPNINFLKNHFLRVA